MSDNILNEITEVIVANPHGGPGLMLYALGSTMRMEKTGYMYTLRKLRDMEPQTRQLAYRLMEFMAEKGNEGPEWEAALAKMDEAVRSGG